MNSAIGTLLEHIGSSAEVPTEAELSKITYDGRTIMTADSDGVAKIQQDLKVNRWIYCGIHNTSSSDNGFYCYGGVNISANSDFTKRCKLLYDGSKLRAQLFEGSTADKSVELVSRTSSQTITHDTNIIGEYEIGTFCEATGEIYDGYEQIGDIDCICKVQTAKDMNNRIVGVICGENCFASHGDVRMKVLKDNYAVGDILAPAEKGYGKKATETDLMYMMMHAVPRAKITSVISDDVVAVFII